MIDDEKRQILAHDSPDSWVISEPKKTTTIEELQTRIDLIEDQVETLFKLYRSNQNEGNQNDE